MSIQATVILSQRQVLGNRKSPRNAVPPQADQRDSGVFSLVGVRWLD